MKKGCFFRSLLLLIVLIGIISYLYQKYGDKIIRSGKEQVKEFVDESIQKAIDNLTDSVEKDSLQKDLEKLIDEFDSKNISLDSNDFNAIKEKFNELIDSNKINFENIEELRKLIKRYEKREKN
ncbi:hypothetical protein MNBD_IGNAVI01-2223 [hydrothermal vent metagenome]|uniref:Uncharacterized protein n=1 Tax=hydrothermal vent metagenome TaxID=652676 RepID=A0A3B1CPU9_9ZZZZ